MTGVLFVKYGEDFTVYTDLAPEGRTIKAFLSPISQTAADRPHTLTRAGLVNKDRFLFIAPASAFSPDEAVAHVTGSGIKYRMLRCDRLGGVLPGGGHIEAILRTEGQVGEDA